MAITAVYCLQCLSAVCLVRTTDLPIDLGIIYNVFSAFRRCVWLGQLLLKLAPFKETAVFSAFRRCVWLGQMLLAMI